MARQFGIFAKHWQPGRVKTRLAADIGSEPAARLHRLSLETLVRRFSAAADRRVLAFTPADRADEFVVLLDAQGEARHWSLDPQASGDLGKRMAHYFASAFAAGARRVVLIGSDSPTLPDGFVVEAFDRLSAIDAVLGPTDDGGYYLIGLSRLVPHLFDDIAWSTPAVFEQTVDRLRAASCCHHVLPLWYDVDTLGDLVRLRSELVGEQSHDFVALQKFVQELAHAAQSSLPRR